MQIGKTTPAILSLALIFIALKVGDVIGWSWWWVLTPLWVIIGSSLLLALLEIWSD